MARKRQIDPSIWTSEQVISLENPWARLLFIGMFSNADDEGRLKGSPAYLKTIIFPGDAHTVAQVCEWRDLITTKELCQRYSVNGTEYISLPTWASYQYISKPYPSKLPAPPALNTGEPTPEPFPNHSRTIPALQHSIGIGIGIGNSRNGDGMVMDGNQHPPSGNGLVSEMADLGGELVTVAEIWTRVLDQLKPMLSTANFNAWVAQTAAVGWSPTTETFTISVPTEHTGAEIVGRLQPVVCKALGVVTGVEKAAIAYSVNHQEET